MLVAFVFLLQTVPWEPSANLAPTTWRPGSMPSLAAGHFVENVGQLANREISYYSEGRAFAVGFADRAVLLRITSEPMRFPRLDKTAWDDQVGARQTGVIVRIAFEGANAVPPEGRAGLPYPINFLLGNDPANWHTGVRGYREVVYRNLYDGVDLLYRASQQGLKYEFIVHGDADPAQIRLAYEGVDSLSLDPKGDLRISTALGELRDAPPEASRDERPVPCSYTLRTPRVVGFRCADGGGEGPLVIDPLVYSTFLGGTERDEALAVALDAAGDAYVTGYTLSADFPTTPGAFDPSANGGRDVFVSKLNGTGTSLEYSTYLGGTGSDTGYGVAVDATGNVFVAGQTTSPDFPTTPGAFDRTCGIDGNCDFDGAMYHYDAFVAKLSATGSSLVYSTFVGGIQNDYANSLALDLAGDAFVTGETVSWDFPTTPGTFDRTCGIDGICNFDGVNYYSDAFVAKLSQAGDALAYSTFLGGAGGDAGLSVTVDSAGNAYLTGDTQSSDFPTTPGAFQRIHGTDISGDAFVTKVNPSGSALVYSTFLGGSGGDETGNAIVIDSSGNAYLAGMTYSPDFPTTSGAFDRSFNSLGAEYDVYVAKLDATGGGLLYSTFLGGSGQDGWMYENLGVTAAGEAYVTGITDSPDFPTTPGAFDRTCGTDGNCNFDGTRYYYDAFVTKLNATGGSLVYSTFLGGQGTDYGRSLAVDAAGDAYVAGMAASSEFPTTAGAFRVTPAGGWDAFVLKLAPLPDIAVSDVSTVPGPPLFVGDPAVIMANLTNLGDVDVALFEVLAFDDQNRNGLADTGEVIGSQVVANLPPSGRVNVSFPWAPNTTGTYRLCAVADPANAVREWNETNNVACVTVLVQPGPVTRPDYAPTSPRPLPPVKVGLSLPVSLSIQVLNRGNATAKTNATLSFYNDATPAPPLLTLILTPIAPGENSSRFNATWLSPATSGMYSVSADVDYYNNITEWDETNNMYTWTIDVVAGPITTLAVGDPYYTSPAMVTYVKSSTPLDFSVTDQSGTGIRNTTYRVGGGAWTNYTATGTFFLAGDGQHRIEWYSVDYAGNRETITSRMLRVDDTPPATTLSIGDPKYLVGGNFTKSSTPLTLQAVDGGTTPVGVQFSRYLIDGGSWTDYSSSFTLVGEGTHTVEYYSRDLLTNTETAHSVQIVVDDTPPATTLSIGSPNHTVGGNFVKSSTPLTLSATDGGVGANSTFYRLWDGSWSSWLQYSSAVDLAGMDGTWFVEFLSYDFLGNRENVQNETLALDNTPPATTISPATAQVESGTYFTLEATDSGSGLNYTEYRVDGGTWTRYTASFTLSEGDHNITYRSVDNLGNLENEKYLDAKVHGPSVPPPPPPAAEANYKPLVALVFAIILAIVGVWSSKRRPWNGGKERMAVAKAFTITSLPFVLAEILTGIFSVYFEPLRIPPVVGWGAGVDILILSAGVLFFLLRLKRKSGGGVKPQVASAQKKSR